jgi:hypothetical protein
LTEPGLPDREQLTLLLDQVEGRLGTQREEWEGLDRKATTILGATGVVFGLVVNSAQPLNAASDLGTRILLSALVVLAGGLVIGILSLAPRRIASVPEPTPLLANYAGASTDLTLGTLITTKAQVFDFNRKVLDSKLRFLVVQMILLAVGGGLLVAALLIE